MKDLALKYHVNTASGCYEWTAAIQSRGHGAVWFEGRVRLAHRVAWVLEHGRWPAADKVLDHICNNRRCVNVEHLRELTNGQNIQRAYPRGNAETEARRAAWRVRSARMRTRRRVLATTKGGE